MVWPVSDVTTANADAATDNPATFRADVLDLIQKFNQLRNHVSANMQGVLAGSALNEVGGNVGVGVVPSAWSNYRAFQFGYTGALSNHVSLNYLRLESNSFNGSGGLTYIQNGFATAYAQNNAAGVHVWYNSPSGTAGNPIPFTQVMTLDQPGNLGLGVVPETTWNFNGRMFQISRTQLFADINTGYLNTNATWNGGFKYIANNFALNYAQDASLGRHIFQSAPSGAAGAAATFTQSLAFGLGTTLALEGATSAAGTGIAFPATQLPSTNPNTLDDYEEGTWTVMLFGGIPTYSAQGGTYTKTGRVVNIRGTLGITVLGGGSTTTMTNLPFVVSSSGNCQGSAKWSGSATAVANIVPQATASGSSITLNSTTGATATLSAANAIFQNGTVVEFSITYETN